MLCDVVLLKMYSNLNSKIAIAKGTLIRYNKGPVDKKGIGAESGGFQLRFSTYARSKG